MKVSLGLVPWTGPEVIAARGWVFFFLRLPVSGPRWRPVSIINESRFREESQAFRPQLTNPHKQATEVPTLLNAGCYHSDKRTDG
ncbi:hypothetical protein SKAU_G00325420 [Synaphobranchus kaupii]|uniref:Uncharacterized protein n=1 Tax=Synaphobranchus kaupii TaxID=118154 RepID=A0A9Q1IKB4_SYNKA|nr:hypothetical protein SKAU_G00325420 [Synaphobranchus kaupii]